MNTNEPNNYYQPPQNPYGFVPPPPGKNLIFVSGILLVIFGGIGVLLTALSLIGGISLGLDGAIVLMIFYEFIVTVLTIVFGVMGIINAKKREKAQSIMNMGIALCAMKIVDLIAAAMIVDVTMSTVVGVIIGLILPFLFIIGGNTNKQGM